MARGVSPSPGVLGVCGLVAVILRTAARLRITVHVANE